MALDDGERKRTDESYDRLTQLRTRRKITSALSIISIAGGFVIIILKFFILPFHNVEDKKNEDIENLKSSIYLQHRLTTFIDSLLIKKYGLPSKALDSTKEYRRLALKIGLLEANVRRDSAQLYDLRESINPGKPEEILKLARLNDKIEQLKSENANLKDNIKAQESQFEQSVNNQMLNARTFYIALITILLPITIKFIMQQFKDYNKE